jgi:hypothetical protein
MTTTTASMNNISPSIESRAVAAKSEPLPANGPAAAALLGAGLGSATLGLMIVLVEASPHWFKNWLNFYNPVGPLSGKTIVAVAVYALSWLVMGIALRGKNVRLGWWVTATFVLIALGILLTFPPIYQLFTRQ